MPQFDRPNVFDIYEQHQARLNVAMASGRKPSVRPDEDPGPSPHLSSNTHGSPRAAGAAAPSKSRSLFDAIRARFGMAEDSTPAEVLAEMDDRLADVEAADLAAQAAAPAASEEDRLYAAAWGTKKSAPTAENGAPSAASSADLAAIAWGA
ncbi:hypothetical protein [Clavibacter zhangzhiyongii]|uniref:hypothetical protein n=1 Tax=Clavibacter zhangzhiyongii TaxID=2768071 RepID=UPI0039DF5334